MSLHDPDYERLDALHAVAKKAIFRANAAVRTAKKAMQERDALQAECEALRADAERHRFTREEARYVKGSLLVSLPWPSGCFPTTADYFDAAIDNERSKA